ncbi:MAG TPA: hypothetical protein DDW42_00710, partial [Desulfobacteraceae bacterium]|nr:hypothetical protein [Desulfobacteraceae bacterium]
MKSGVKSLAISSRERSPRSSSEALLKHSALPFPQGSKAPAPQAKRPSSKSPAFNYWIENITVCREKHPYLNIDWENLDSNKRVISMDSRRGAPTFE